MPRKQILITRPMSEAETIRVERGAEVRPGVFAWRVPVLGLSRQPLLDACREIKSILGGTGSHAALFRPGRTHWDARCSVEWGAAHAVKEPSSGSIRFSKYKTFEPTAVVAPARGNAHRQDDPTKAAAPHTLQIEG